MSSRKLNFDEDTKQFVALYTNIKGEEIEKIFTRQPADKTWLSLLPEEKRGVEEVYKEGAEEVHNRCRRVAEEVRKRCRIVLWSS
jgi:hypothetical protein